MMVSELLLLQSCPLVTDLRGPTYAPDVSIDLLSMEGLTSLAGAESVVSSFLYLDDVPALPDLTDLGSLTTPEELHLEHVSLVDATGLEAVTEVGGNLTLRHNASFTSFEGLEGLTAISSSLVVEDSGVLDLRGLTGLETVGINLEITDNADLTSLAGLEAVESVGYHLRITDNPTLTDVSALSAITEVGGDVEITGNPGLAAADAQALVDSIEVIGGKILVYDNGP